MGKSVGASPMGGVLNPDLTSKPANPWPLHPERSYWRGRPGPGGLHLQRQNAHLGEDKAKEVCVGS